MKGLLFASVCGAVCALLAGAGFEKYVKYIAALVCVFMMIAPLKGIVLDEYGLSGIGELSVGEISVDAPLIAEQMAEENAEAYICEIVFGKFGIKEVSANIVIDWSGPDAVIREITVAVPAEENGIIGEIRDYLVQTLGGEVNVVEA